MKKRLFKIVSLLMLSIFLLGSTTTVANAATTYEELVVEIADHSTFKVHYGAKIKYNVHGIISVEPILDTTGIAPPEVKLSAFVINKQTTHTVEATLSYTVENLVTKTGYDVSVYFKSPFSHSGGGTNF